MTTKTVAPLRCGFRARLTASVRQLSQGPDDDDFQRLDHRSDSFLLFMSDTEEVKMRLVLRKGWGANGWRAVMLLQCLAWGVSATAGAQVEAVKIGVLVPLSGPMAEIGSDQYRGMLLAFDAGRASLESSRQRLEVVYDDDQCKPGVGMSRAQSLVERNRAAVLLGAPCTDTSAAVAAYAEQQRVPFLSTGSLPEEQQSGRERMAFQLGVSRKRVGQLAQQLSAKTGLKVDGGTGCLWTYRPFVADGFVASVCPSLSIERTRWEDLQQRYHQKFSAKPGAGAAIGFAAMQIMMEAMKGRLDRREELVRVLNTQTFETIVGHVNVGADGGLRSMLRVIPGALAGSSDKEKLAAETTHDDCDKCKKAECPQGSYKELRYSAKTDDCCKKPETSECPQGSLLFFE